jgi:hypothetical protein
LIISGDPGPDKNAAVRFNDWTQRWTALLTDTYGFKKERVRVLSTPAASPNDGATQENCVKALGALARESSAEDQVVLILIGHGYDTQKLSKLCLKGKDLSDIDAAKALAELRARQLICINTTAASSSWAKSLARAGRVIIVASGTEGLRSQTYFCEFMLRALKAGNITLLDAFNRAALDTIHWYQNQFISKDGTKVHGKEFQEIWKAMYPGQTMIAGGDQPQAANNNMADTAAWLGRRVLPEVAGLEDNGDGELSSVYEDGKEPAPLPSKAGDGEVARKIVLGKP